MKFLNDPLEIILYVKKNLEKHLEDFPKEFLKDFVEEFSKHSLMQFVEDFPENRLVKFWMIMEFQKKFMEEFHSNHWKIF